eukprot:186323-Rhodomonas_salina.2
MVLDYSATRAGCTRVVLRLCSVSWKRGAADTNFPGSSTRYQYRISRSSIPEVSTGHRVAAYPRSVPDIA